ncbi:uncharacterized protein VTP21DRAFT_4596 [Calcarisporiella thermophila]|uniref:uncharacterized protein n=1 Tax=Calcarisporiella thermophila TaxID=911321 RepID=UPI00374442A1
MSTKGASVSPLPSNQKDNPNSTPLGLLANAASIAAVATASNHSCTVSTASSSTYTPIHSRSLSSSLVIVPPTVNRPRQDHVSSTPLTISTSMRNGLFTTLRLNTPAHVKKNASDKQWICERCDLTFARQHNLKSHYLTHSDERPFKVPSNIF